jgi:hypothetical protein
LFSSWFGGSVRAAGFGLIPHPRHPIAYFNKDLENLYDRGRDVMAQSV